jgi:hypothetical protein
MGGQLKRPSVILLSIALIATAIVVAAAGASGNNSHGRRLTHTVTVRPASKLLASEFGILGQSSAARGATSANYQPLPRAVVEGMDRAQPEMEPSSAAFAGGTYPTWVVPGTNHVCLVLGSTGANSVPSSSCGSTTGAGQHGLVISTENGSGTPVIVGLVPNGNPVVKVTDTNGASKGVSIVSNVYEITSGAPRSVTFRDASGNETTQPIALASAPPPASAPAN